MMGENEGIATRGLHGAARSVMMETMANPEHIPELDGFDRLTVTLYRSGLSLGTLGVVGLSAALVLHWPVWPAQVLITAGMLMAVVNMHLYDKRVRWVIGTAAQLGAWLQLLGAWLQVPLVVQAGLGFSFVALSAYALKEQFCFRIPGLRLVPLGLASGLVPLVFDLPMVAAAIYGLTVLPLVVLCVGKWRMPVHFDVGDKSRYQV